MPRRITENETQQDLESGLVEGYKNDIATVYELGLLFLEMLDDVEKQRGNYHTIGANRLHTKFLVTSNCNGSKFYAGGARLADLAIDLCEEYSWHGQAVYDALQSALGAYKKSNRLNT